MMEEEERIKKIIVIYNAETRQIIAKELSHSQADHFIFVKAKENTNILRNVEREEGRFITFQLDPLDPLAVELAASEIEQKLGPIDIWINPPVSDPLSFYRQLDSYQTRVSSKASYSVQVFGTLSALRRMLPRNRGRIIFISPDLLFAHSANQATYAASRRAIEEFYSQIKAELKEEESDIKINSIDYPLINTGNLDPYNCICTFNTDKVNPMAAAKLAIQGLRYILENGRVDRF